MDEILLIISSIYSNDCDGCAIPCSTAGFDYHNSNSNSNSTDGCSMDIDRIIKENDDKAKEIAYNGIKYIETNFSNLKREFHLEKKIVVIIEPHLSD